MSIPAQVRVLFFDVFGTCVAQRPAVANELLDAAREALGADGSLIKDEVRRKAEAMSYEEWDQFGAEWDKDVDDFVNEGKARDSVDWVAVDKYRFQSFRKLLSQRGLVILDEDSNTSELDVKKGSLWNASQLKHLGAVWHRLPPWPDTCSGLKLLNKQFSTVTLSNTYNDLMKSLVAHSSIPFQHVYTSDQFHSYKPNPKVYLGAAEKMDVKPEECALVAAHLSDLKGAKACGFHVIYVERPLEEKAPHLRKEKIPDLIIEQNENGFVTLAERLGTQSS